jgi:hypothetical protein
MVFWNAILSGEARPEARPMHNRTLTYWVQLFNKWQQYERKEERKLPQCVLDGNELKPLLQLSKMNYHGIIDMFDPKGSSRLDQEGNFSMSALSRIRMPMQEFCAAGVMTSSLISSKHKLQFLIGLVDLEDTGYLDEATFANFIKVFTHGLGVLLEFQPPHSHQMLMHIAFRCHFFKESAGLLT